MIDFVVILYKLTALPLGVRLVLHFGVMMYEN